MKTYILRRKTDGKFKDRTRNGWDSDINKARMYNRKCDATNSANCHCPYGHEILEHKKQLQVQYKVVATRQDVPNHATRIGENVFPTRQAAEAFRIEHAKTLKMHVDYLKIEQYIAYAPSLPPAQYIRPSWQDYFLGLAFIVSRRSHDIQTQHGSIIVDSENRILGTGYNGFAKGLANDNTLPNTRPDKYDWMLHSEVNALANCTLRPYNATLYITGEPCNQCLMQLWQNGVKKVICGSLYGWQQNNEKSRAVFNEFIKRSGMQIEYVKPDLTWIHSLAADLPRLLSREKT